MSDSKLAAALTTLEEARSAALKLAISERAFRVCAVLDETGHIQRGINRARRMLAPKPSKKSKA